MKKPVLLTIALIALATVFFVYKMYNKEHTNVDTANVLQEMSASDLFTAFDNNEEEATQQYAEQVVSLKGLLFAKDVSNNAEPQLVLVGNGDDGFIRCGFVPENTLAILALTDGATVTIKGLCKGFNAAEDLDLLADRDVVMSNCILIEQPKTN